MSKVLDKSSLEALRVDLPVGPSALDGALDSPGRPVEVLASTPQATPSNRRPGATSGLLGPMGVGPVGRYTIAGLFQSGTFGPDEETAIEEIRGIRQAFGQMTSPSRGWMTPRYGSGPPATPRILANGPAWRRYTSWRERWSAPAVARCPSYPWGLSAADLTCMALLEPWNITDLARLSGKSDLVTVELVIRVVTDYGSELKRTREQIWKAWDGIPKRDAANRARNRRMRGAERAKRFRAKKVTPKTLRIPEPV